MQLCLRPCLRPHPRHSQSRRKPATINRRHSSQHSIIRRRSVVTRRGILRKEQHDINTVGGWACIRPATVADRWAIRRLVYPARLNPLDLDWRRFLVAEVEGRIVGTIQARHHADGTRELASLAVAPALQRLRIGAALIGALREREPGPLHLYCASSLAGYYEHFGFQPIPIRDLPPSLRGLGRIARAVAALARLVRAEVPRLIFMRAEERCRPSVTRGTR